MCECPKKLMNNFLKGNDILLGIYAYNDVCCKLSLPTIY